MDRTILTVQDRGPLLHLVPTLLSSMTVSLSRLATAGNVLTDASAEEVCLLNARPCIVRC